jgi:L-ascorbate metabolism protein UlaG (beta-lactamase superfamily)
MNLLRPAVVTNGKFQNPIPTSVGSLASLPRILLAALTTRAERVPKVPLGPFHTDPAAYLVPSETGLRITWLGHSSMLVEIDGTTLLIDPVYSQRASMVQWFGPQRFFPPPLAMEDLPPLDAVLLSHDHYDHLDAAAIPLLRERTPRFICSLAMENHLNRWGIPNAEIHSMNWTDTYTLPGGLKITALPARHFTGRGLRRFRTLWSSFMLEGPKHRIYFGADSGPWPGFRHIGEQFGPIDLAMLEVGAHNDLWGSIHLGPDHALGAARDLQAKQMMPIHWGLFNLAFHAWNEPADRITRISRDARLPLFMPEPGLPTDVTGDDYNTFWWARYLER